MYSSIHIVILTWQHTLEIPPFRSALDVAVEALLLRRLVVEAVANVQSISDAMTSRADLLAYLLRSERQETSSFPQSLSVDHFDATPAQRSDSGCTRSGETGEQIMDVRSPGHNRGPQQGSAVQHRRSH